MARTVKHTWENDPNPAHNGEVRCKVCGAEAFFSRKSWKFEPHAWFNKDCSKQLVTSVLSE